MNLNFHHRRPGWSAVQLRDDAHEWGTSRMEYSAQWVTALTEAAVATGVAACDLDDEIWAQLKPGDDRSVKARKAILLAVVAELLARAAKTPEPDGWTEDRAARGWRYRVTVDGVTFDTAAVDPTAYHDPRWRQRWEHDLRREVAKHKEGRRTKLHPLDASHYRLPGTV